MVVAILAKDKEHCLPRYLKCLESQTWPKSRTLLYVRTNNNNDRTSEMLQAWVDVQRKLMGEKDGKGYVSIYIDTSDVEVKVQQWLPHEWNGSRFKVLGAIRRASVEYAIQHDAHYFVADCDNFIAPSTLEAMCESGYDAIAPLLTTSGYYSNLHFKVNSYGYMDQTWCDRAMPELKLRGVVECEVIHCTYFLSCDVLKHAIYDDGTGRYEYAILADQMRKAKVAQYMDNRVDYGRITFADDLKALEAEPWIGLFPMEPVAPTSTDVVAPSGLLVTYGGTRTLRMDVTQRCCNLFLHRNTLLIPAGCDFNARFGDPRHRIEKTLDIIVDGKLVVSIPEHAPGETRVGLATSFGEPARLISSSSTSSSPSVSTTLSTTLGTPVCTEERKVAVTTATKGEKWLIISPQAGFGNRLRAMCSGILLAKKLGRKPVHAWLPESEEEEVVRHTKVEHLRQTCMRGWTDYFVAHQKVPAIDYETVRRECKTIKCYTEWMPGEFWYAAQSRCQRHLAGLGVTVDVVRLGEDATSLVLKDSDAPYLLLETSLSVRASGDVGEQKTKATEDTRAKKRYERKLSRVYRKYFAPNKVFTDIMATLVDVPVGLSIRRGEFLQYFPAANVSEDALVAQLTPIIGARSYVLFSDDYAFRDVLVTKLPKNVYDRPVKLEATIPEQWKRAFIEFLMLALKCDVVYGTKSSSFASEAALFGGKPYVAL